MDKQSSRKVIRYNIGDWVHVEILRGIYNQKVATLAKIVGLYDSSRQYTCFPVDYPTWGTINAKEIVRLATDEEVVLWNLEN